MATSFAFGASAFVFICYSLYQVGGLQGVLKLKDTFFMDEVTSSLPQWVATETCHPPEENCRVVFPTLGPSIDLSPLKHPSYYSITDSSNSTLLLVNVCKPIRGTTCPGDGIIGACLVQAGTEAPAGTFSRNLLWDRGLVKMLYEPTAGSQTSTMFVFPCDPEETGSGRYSMTYNSDMVQFEVVWYTNLTCFPENKGILHTNSWLVNMSSLTKQGDNYYKVHIEKSEEILYFNLFKALPLQPGNCKPGTMACLFLPGIDDIISYTTNASGYGIDMGRRIVLFQKIDNYTVELVYGDGDQCPFCHYTKLSTRFLFFCSPEEVGPLVAGMAEDHCQLVIEWYSHRACPVNVTYLVDSLNKNDLTNQTTEGYTDNSTKLGPESPGWNKTLDHDGGPVDDVMTTCGMPILAAGLGCFTTGVLLTFCCLALYYYLCLRNCCPRGGGCWGTCDPTVNQQCCCGTVTIKAANTSPELRMKGGSLGTRPGGRREACSVGEARASRLARLTSPGYSKRRGVPVDTDRLGYWDTPSSLSTETY